VIALSLFVLISVYFVGLWRMFSRMHRPDLVSRKSIAAFVGGWLSLVVALGSPLHRLGEQLFWAHMTQHEILMLVAAPLLVWSRPLPIFLWALPPEWRGFAGRIASNELVCTAWRSLTLPMVAWSLQFTALWLWHTPAMFDAAVRSDFVHAMQHLSFIGTALLFWWALMYSRPGELDYGRSILYLFTTAAYSGALGALLTFSSHPWYGAYKGSTLIWQLNPLEDQQLGGLIMWVPAGAALVGIALAMIPKWLKTSDRRWELSRTSDLMSATQTATARRQP
jgi:putative membrane protein